MIRHNKKNIVVIGNGMVGCKFCANLIDQDEENQFEIITFCEEPRPAYDRVHLSEYFSGKSAKDLELKPMEWYFANGITLHLEDAVSKIDRANKTVFSKKGREIEYDTLILATGSAAFVPPIPGVEKEGVFVYRTIEDLDEMMAYAKNCKSATVIGGGLLGLEAAKATKDMGLATSVVEFAPKLMPRQLDDVAAHRLLQLIEDQDIKCYLNHITTAIEGDGKVEKMTFKGNDDLQTDMVVVSAGIRPRDELAKECGLEVGDRGGVIVDDNLLTSDPDIYAIGEVALHNNFIYGLVAPGYQMTEVVVDQLLGKEAKFTGADMSTKLKLIGTDVASFGNFEGTDVEHDTVVIDDPKKGVYKKLVISEDNKKLLGGILVGDASAYANCLMMYQNGTDLPENPMDLIQSGGGSSAVLAMPDETQICTCENVSKGDILQAMEEHDCCNATEIKNCTRAGSGCGGCVPIVNQLVKAKLKADGKDVNESICEHFNFDRIEMFNRIKADKIKTFEDLLIKHGKGSGCEICKPAAASILASLWNEPVHRFHNLQDTNDHFLANMQKNGSYSVIPRLPGGEVTADKLIVIGQVAKKYNLYVKLTGGQRIAMLGARVDQLPDIWKELLDAGFESGQAYGKSLRTIKSCVGQSWCRFGVQDSSGLAVEMENRYKGLRSPHKLKSAVSGCTRECAEARSKDFGVIATDKGWNLYVSGNGGMQPQHGLLLAADIDKETVLKYTDRFLMYYVRTADKLTRTSTWLNNLDGGIEHLKDVIINDSLGICDELDKQMEYHINTYECDWRAALDNKEFMKRFRSFINTDETDKTIQFEINREQIQPKMANV